MTDREVLKHIYKQNLEESIVVRLADILHIDYRKAMDLYYKSKLSGQIAEGSCGIDNLDPKYLVEDLLENEADLFKEN